MSTSPSYRSGQTNQVPVPVVLDVDTGVDDALALLLAVLHPDLELRAVTCVQGNTYVDQVARNTLTVLDAAGAPHVPVAIGADRPLVEPPGPTRTARHGTDGLADLGRAAPSRSPDSRSATRLLRDALRPEAPVDLITLGPLTNIAALLAQDPRAVDGINRVVAVGGFNLAHDPEAAAAVFTTFTRAGLSITVYGSDVFYRPLVSAQQARTLPDTTAGALAADLVRFCFARDAASEATIGDAGAVCAVLDPSGLETVRRTARIALTGPRRGHLVADPTGVSLDLAAAVEGPHYVNVWLGAFG
jgi:inosine-uridine nucleoside N-ribohydrolase